MLPLFDENGELVDEQLQKVEQLLISLDYLKTVPNSLALPMVVKSCRYFGGFTCWLCQPFSYR